MRTKLAIFALGALFALSAVLAGLVIAGPAATQGDPPQADCSQSVNTFRSGLKRQRNALAPLTAGRTDQVGGRPVREPAYRRSFRGVPGRNPELWTGAFSTTWVRTIEPYYREFEVRYRITRRQDEISDVPWPWELLDEAVSDTRWAGGLDTGRWVYRVAASSVARDGQTFTCENTGGSGRATILNPANLAGFAEGMCPGLDVYEAWLESYSMDEDYQNVTLGLAWVTYVDDRLHIVPPYDDYDVGYNIFRKPDGPEGERLGWELVDRVTGEEQWHGAADAGQWVYWVAASYVETGGQRAYCPYELPVTATVEIDIPTAAEAGLQQERREILVAEMTRCAKRGMTANISDDALPIINEYVENLIAAQVEEEDDLDDLSRLTVLACWDESGAAGGFSPWLFLSLLESGF